MNKRTPRRSCPRRDHPPLKNSVFVLLALNQVPLNRLHPVLVEPLHHPVVDGISRTEIVLFGFIDTYFLILKDDLG